MSILRKKRISPYSSPDEDIDDLIELGYSPHKINKLIKKRWKITDKELLIAWEISLEYFRFWQFHE
jgi:hypothetical protein